MRTLIILSIALFLVGCNTSSEKNTETTVPTLTDPAQAAQIEFEKSVYDFGKILEGEKIQYTFRFTNTGKSPLVITNAQATCGCTVPDWSREAIAPGAGGEIKVIFDSKGRSGVQIRPVVISANTPQGTYEVQLIGEVISDKVLQ